MSSHDLTAAVYIAIALVGVAIELASRRAGARIPSLGQVFERAMRTRSGRVGILAGWAWLGLHLFAK
jgi:uncharacterized protein DUF6186